MQEADVVVVSVDMETFKSRSYPDVLIEIVRKVLVDVAEGIESKTWRDRRRLKKLVHPLISRLNQILDDPSVVTTEFSREDIASQGHSVEGNVRFENDLGGFAASGRKAKLRQVRAAQNGRHSLTKDERLSALVPELNRVFQYLVSCSQHCYGLVFLDDFYHVSSQDQPKVLDFLHRSMKGTGLYLKVGGLGARLQPFKDGDPPIGMQIGHDISRLALDVTLTDFNTGKRFLETMIEGVLRPLDVSVKELLTNDARDRLVLAAGGAVARDYITLVKGALEKTVDRLSQEGEISDDQEVRIGTAEVQKTMSALTQLREEDSFNLDAVSDADALRDRWRNIQNFANEEKTVFILIPQRNLDDRDFGREIGQLEQLRLLHRIKETTANSEKWKGVPMVVFMRDLGSAAQQRLKIEIPPFWKSTAESDKLRRAGWIYVPSGV